jgi:hypothetical protein
MNVFQGRIVGLYKIVSEGFHEIVCLWKGLGVGFPRELWSVVDSCCCLACILAFVMRVFFKVGVGGELLSKSSSVRSTIV